MKTVQIVPTKAFSNRGQLFTATQLNVESKFDNLFDRVIFGYVLLGDDNQRCGESTFSLAGLDQYTTWDNTAANAFAIVAAGIGVETIKPEGEDKTIQFLEIM